MQSILLLPCAELEVLAISASVVIKPAKTLIDYNVFMTIDCYKTFNRRLINKNGIVFVLIRAFYGVCVLCGVPKICECVY